MSMNRARVVAIISMFNEADIIEDCIHALHTQGVDAYVLDDGSTDGSADLVRGMVGRGVLAVESLPSEWDIPSGARAGAKGRAGPGARGEVGRQS